MKAVTHREKKFNKAMDDRGNQLLRLAQVTWDAAEGLDTAVRDEIAQGVAFIVRAGYDCLASNLDVSVDSRMRYIDHSTEEWFRAREFAEWFCIAAARGFDSSRPRNVDRWISRKPARRKRRATTKKAKG